MDDFIKPKEALEILKVSKNTLRLNFAKMNIRRTLQKPYLYHRGDCIKWRTQRTQHVPLEVPTMSKQRLTRRKRLINQVLRQQQINL